MGNRDKARAAIYVMMGGYLLYLAYKLFTSQSGAEDSESAVMLIFGIFFVIVGVAAFALAFYMSRKGGSHGAETDDGEKEESLEEKGDMGGK